MAGSYTRLSKVTFVTGAGLTRAVIQLRGQSLTTIQPILNLSKYLTLAATENLQQFDNTDGKTLFWGSDKPDM